jgi:hypothetical protein
MLQRRRTAAQSKPQLILVFGGVGAGKTAFMTYNAVTSMTDRLTVRGDLKGCQKIVDKLNEGGARYTVPADHLVFADYRIAWRGGRVSYEIDMKNLGLPSSKNLNAQFFPPFSRLFMDEAQRKFNSRKGGIADELSLFFEIHRHNDLNIMLACQRERLIDLNVRELVSKIIEIRGMKHKYKAGRLIETTWTCREFDNCFLIDKYLESGKVEGHGVVVCHTYYGNIFKCYDHQHSRPAFFNGCYTKDFDLRKAVKSDFSVASMKDYNERHFEV